MKKSLITLLSILCAGTLLGQISVSYTNINVGTGANDGTGDSLRLGGQKMNQTMNQLGIVATNAVNTNSGTAHNLTHHGTLTITGNVQIAGKELTNLFKIAGPVLYVTTNGNDATAVVGRRDLPWRTPSNAVDHVSLNALHNSTILLGEGRWQVHGRDGMATVGKTDYDLEMYGGLSNITFMGMGPSTIIHATNGGGVMSFSNVWNLRLSNFRLSGTRSFTGGSPSASLFSAMYFQTNYANVMIDNVWFNDHQDHAIVGNTGVVSGTNVVVRNCWFINIGETNTGIIAGGGRDGTCVANLGFGNVVDGCTFIDCHRAWEPEGESRSYHGQKFVNNTLYDVLGEGVFILSDGTGAAGGEFGFTNYHGILIADNYFHTSNTNKPVAAQQLIACNGAQNLVIARNQFYVTDNIAVGLVGGTNFYNVQIKDNQFTRCTYGIVVDEGSAGARRSFASNIVISGNQLLGPQQHAIKFIGHDSVIENNAIFDANNYAIWLQEPGSRASTNVQVRFNKFHDSDTYSIFIDQNCQDIALYHNEIFGGGVNKVSVDSTAEVWYDLMFVDGLRYNIANAVNYRAMASIKYEVSNGSGGGPLHVDWTNTVMNTEQSDLFNIVDIAGSSTNILIRYPGTYLIRGFVTVRPAGGASSGGTVRIITTNASWVIYGGGFWDSSTADREKFLPFEGILNTDTPIHLNIQMAMGTGGGGSNAGGIVATGGISGSPPHTYRVMTIERKH